MVFDFFHFHATHDHDATSFATCDEGHAECTRNIPNDCIEKYHTAAIACSKDHPECQDIANASKPSCLGVVKCKKEGLAIKQDCFIKSYTDRIKCNIARQICYVERDPGSMSGTGAVKK